MKSFRKQQKGSQNMAYIFFKGQGASGDEVKVLEGITSSSIEISNDIKETSATKDEVANDTDGVVWATNIDGTRSWSLSLDINVAEDKDGVPTQQKVLDMIVDADDTALEIWYGKLVKKSNGGLGFDGKKGQGRIASYSQSDPIDDASTISLSITGNGPLTRITEADLENVKPFQNNASL